VANKSYNLLYACRVYKILNTGLCVSFITARTASELEAKKSEVNIPKWLTFHEAIIKNFLLAIQM
jgi:hypothetical protein